jgi:hypothetical protein
MRVAGQMAEGLDYELPPVDLDHFPDFSRTGFRRRTPGPPPFSSMNSTAALCERPIARLAPRIFCSTDLQSSMSPSDMSGAMSPCGKNDRIRSTRARCSTASRRFARCEAERYRAESGVLTVGRLRPLR